jgi:translation initiation factor 2-alpha kinase 3
MSSFFRNPNDVTESEDQTDSETSDSYGRSRDDDENLPPLTTPKANRLQKIETLDSTSSATTVALSRPLSRDNGGGNQETSEWIMRALLEEKCLNDALADFEKHNTSGKPYTKDHPDVRALAQAKYEYMTETLGKLEVLPAGPERRDSAARVAKQQVRDGLDLLSSQTPQPNRPALMRRDVSLLSMHSGIPDLVVAESANRSIRQLPFYQQEAMSQSMDAITGLPPLLRPLVDHPMFELSRYLRDFVELRMIGKGGYGKVYHVQHRLDGSDYAVKKINLNAHRLKRIQERGQAELDALLIELRMLAKFDHPNIVRYYGGWLEYSTTTPFPSPAAIGKLMIEAPRSSAHTSTSTERSYHDDRVIGVVDSQRVPDLSRNGIDIMFEHSGGEILGDLDDMDEQDDLLAELHPQIKATRRRRGSTSTTSSAKSKLNSMQSIGLDDEEPDTVEGILQFMHSTDSSDPDSISASVSRDFENKPEHDAVLTLHIQMSLHPLSLAEYLATGTISESPPPGPRHARHCFHLDTSLRILLALLDGVEYLHGCGVVHRDLKPSNVFLTLNPSRTPGCIDLSKCAQCRQDGHMRSGFLSARIGDFGLVTEIARASENSKPVPMKAVGTELYRPTHAASKPNEKLDVYALGIIAVELLHPFGTRMERHKMLQEVRGGMFDDTVLTVRYGELGRVLAVCIREMTYEGEWKRLSCAQVRGNLERLITQM